MCASVSQPKRKPISRESILLFDVPRETYEALIDALSEHRVPHTYQEGTLELKKTLFFNVPWDRYENILAAFGERRFPHTYQDGTLEIMVSPSNEHEWIKRCLGRMIEMTVIEFGIPIRSAGSTTQRQEKVMQGLEPDESYYIEHEPLVRGKRLLAAKKVLPPDLVIEVDLRKLNVARMKSYAKLGIHELWRYRKGKVEFFCLNTKRAYEPVERSHAFPMIASKEVAKFLRTLAKTDENTAIVQFVSSLRKKSQRV